MSSNPDNSETSVTQPTAEQVEVEEDEVISLEGDISDISCEQQLQKECHEKSSNTELRVAKLMCVNARLNAENKALKAELEKQKLMVEQIELKAKINKLEQEKEQQQQEKYVSVGVFNLIVERIAKLENQQQNAKGAKRKKKFKQNWRTTKPNQSSAIVHEQIAEETPLANAQNCWDSIKCHGDIKIADDNHLAVEHKGSTFGWRSVFAKYSILNCRSGIFYFEVKIIFVKRFATIGIAAKAMALDEAVGHHNFNSYGYQSDGTFCHGSYPHDLSPLLVYGMFQSQQSAAAFSTGDVVGFGVYLANHELFFTKNGHRLNSNKQFLSLMPPSSNNSLFPCVSLWESGDKIEANFGPNFKFGLPTF